MKNLLRVWILITATSAVTLCFATGNLAKCFWIAPTTYMDGSPLPASEIDHYTLTWAPETGQVGPSGSLNVPGNMLSAPVAVPCGATSFTVSVTTTATAKYPNTTSGPAGPVPYVSGITCTPNPPSGLAAQ